MNSKELKIQIIFDAFEILNRIDGEEESLKELDNVKQIDTKQGFAERRSK